MLDSGEEKNPTVENDKNSTIEGGGIGMNQEGKEQHCIFRCCNALS